MTVPRITITVTVLPAQDTTVLVHHRMSFQQMMKSYRSIEPRIEPNGIESILPSFLHGLGKSTSNSISSLIGQQPFFPFVGLILWTDENWWHPSLPSPRESPTFWITSYSFGSRTIPGKRPTEYFLGVDLGGTLHSSLWDLFEISLELVTYWKGLSFHLLVHTNKAYRNQVVLKTNSKRENFLKVPYDFHEHAPDNVKPIKSY